MTIWKRSGMLTNIPRCFLRRCQVYSNSKNKVKIKKPYKEHLKILRTIHTNTDIYIQWGTDNSDYFENYISLSSIIWHVFFLYKKNWNFDFFFLLVLRLYASFIWKSKRWFLSTPFRNSCLIFIFKLLYKHI